MKFSIHKNEIIYKDNFLYIKISHGKSKNNIIRTGIVKSWSIKQPSLFYEGTYDQRWVYRCWNSFGIKH